MKKYYLFILLAMTTVFAASLSSCSETDNEKEEYPNWRKTNEAYYDKKYAEVKQLVAGGAADWKVLRSWSLNDQVATHSYDFVLANVLNAGTGSGCPLFTDSVKVHYSGRLLPSTSYAEGYVFDKSWQGEYNLSTMKPRTFAVSGVVKGFATALQNMHIGDRWLVYMPHQLAYGSSATPGAAYSTLIFDVTLVGYFRKTAATAAPAKDGTAQQQTTGYWVYE